MSGVRGEAELSGLFESVQVVEQSVDFDFVCIGLTGGIADGEVEVGEGVKWKFVAGFQECGGSDSQCGGSGEEFFA